MVYNLNLLEMQLKYLFLVAAVLSAATIIATVVPYQMSYTEEEKQDPNIEVSLTPSFLNE